jgi:hypothetical protein
MTSGYKPEPTGATPPKTVPDQGSSIAPPHCPHTEVFITLGPHTEVFIPLGPGARIRVLPEKRRPYSWLALNQPPSTEDTLDALIRDAVATKRSALWWQAYVKQGKTQPFCPTFARECAEYWQRRLVRLLTQIIAGDEATLAAHGGKP